MPETRWEPGQRFGPDFDPEQYELLEFHHRGGEAEVWRAVRTGHTGMRELVAAKIMLERDPTEVRRWLGRWDDVSHNAHRLGIVDLVVPTFFTGPNPHRTGRAPREVLGYQISPWFDGVALHRWAGANKAGAPAVADVLLRLCQIVDTLHEKRWVHRDISPANVLVAADGQVKLIDLTFLASLDHAVTVAVLTPGHAPPEIERVGGLPSTAKDLFAVGTLARTMLLPGQRRLAQHDAAEQARAELIEAGYSRGLAEWACEPLAVDPDQRPRPLTAWAERGSALLREHRPPPRIAALTVLADPRGRPLVIAAGATGLEFAGPALAHTAVPSGRPPTRIRNLAAAYTSTASAGIGTGVGIGGSGSMGASSGAGGRAAAALAVFAQDAAGNLWAGGPSGWSEAARGTSGLAGAVAGPGGELVVWTAAGSSLRSFRWAPEQTLIARELPECPADRVLAAAAEAAGDWLVVTERHNRPEAWRIQANGKRTLLRLDRATAADRGRGGPGTGARGAIAATPAPAPAEAGQAAGAAGSAGGAGSIDSAGERHVRHEPHEPEVRSAELAHSSAGLQAAVLYQDGTVTLHSLAATPGTADDRPDAGQAHPGVAGAPGLVSPVAAAAIARNPRPRSREITETEPALGVALAGHRGGPTVALAGPAGIRLRVATPVPTNVPTATAGWHTASGRTQWWRPTLRPATHTALTVADGWRLCLAAVVEDELQCWQEDAAYRWQPVDLTADPGT